MIHHYGPLTTSIVTTLRKFLTIVANTLYYGHEMGGSKWRAILVVFGGVVLERYGGGLEKKQRGDNKKVKSE